MAVLGSLALADWIEGEAQMPTLIVGDDLREAVKAGTFIKGGDPAHAEGVKYDLTLGTMLLRAGSAPIDTSKLTEAERTQLEVGPGEVVFALTEERLELPRDIMAQLSPKRSISHAGVLIIGGFCIDPGYNGRLLLGLYNLSSTPFRLIPGNRVIAATFFRLEGVETGEFPVPKSLDKFPPELLFTMEKYKPEGGQAFLEALRRVQEDVQSLRNEVTKHDRFEEILQRHDNQIEKLLTSLTVEADARKSGDDSLSRTVEKMDQTLGRLITMGKVVAGLATTLILTLLAAWLSKLLGFI